jgi:septal ring factor EnvC (AmiA/AmiB activator)
MNTTPELDQIVIADHGTRIRQLEQDLLPVTGQLVEGLKFFAIIRDEIKSLGEDVREVKGDVKTIATRQSDIIIQMTNCDNRIKDLERFREDRAERYKRYRSWVIGIVTPIIATVIIYWLKLK